MLVVFHGRTRRWWAKLCRPGFRHVFVCVLANGFWVLVDPRSGGPRIETIAVEGYDLVNHYREQGYTVVPTGALPSRPIRWAWMVSTCVGVVKKILGIRAWWIQTPWQLYRHIGESNER